MQRPQRRRERCQPYERVVVGLHHVVVAMREDGWQRGEVGVGLAGVHVLGAVEDDDVLEAEDLQRDQHPLLGLGEPAEDELDVNSGNGGGLRAVDEAEEVAAVVEVGASQDTDKEAELSLSCGWSGGGDKAFIGEDDGGGLQMEVEEEECKQEENTKQQRQPTHPSRTMNPWLVYVHHSI